MSADPVDPAPATGAGPRDATIIDIRNLVSRPASGGRKPAGGHLPHPGDRSSEHLLAEHLEKTFNEQHLTLADDDIAAAFRTTLTVVSGLLDGAHAQGIVDESQHHRLNEIIDGLRGAPDLV
jgi:hypothetical protein